MTEGKHRATATATVSTMAEGVRDERQARGLGEV